MGPHLSLVSSSQKQVHTLGGLILIGKQEAEDERRWQNEHFFFLSVRLDLLLEVAVYPL